MARRSIRRRVDTLENERRVRENEDNEELIRNYDEFWEMELEHTALHLLRGVEPYLTLDERDRFLTLDGRFALSRRRMDLCALMGPLTQQIQQSIPSERWRQFLASDEEAAESALAAFGRLPDLVDAAAERCSRSASSCRSTLHGGFTTTSGSSSTAR